MLNLIVSSGILLIVVLFVGIGLLRGRKQQKTYAWIRLLSLVVSAAVAVVASIFAARGLMNLALGMIPFGGDLQDAITGSPLLTESIGALLAMLLAPSLFFVLFWIVKGILGAISRRVARKLIRKELAKAEQAASLAAEEPVSQTAEASAEETAEVATAAEAVAEAETGTVDEAVVEAEPISVEPVELPKKDKKAKKTKKFAILRTEKASPIGMLCGALCGLVLCLVWLVPVVGPLSQATRAVDTLMENSSASVGQTIGEISDQTVGSTGVRALNMMGVGKIYTLLTSQPVNGEWTNLSRELDVVASIGNGVSAVRNPELSRSDAAKQVLAVEDSFERAQLIPTLISEVLGTATDHWNRGESFLGIAKPSFGGEEMGDMMDAVWNCLSTADTPTLKQDVGTVVHVLAIVVERDAWQEMKANPLSALEDQELSRPVIYELLSNDHISPLVGEIAEISIQTLGRSLDADLTGIELNTASIQNKEAEAIAISNVFGKAVDLMDYMQEHPTTDGNTIRMVGPLLDALSATEMAGKQTAATLLQTLLESEKIYTAIGYTKDEASRLAATINEKAVTSGYEPLMLSVGQMLEVVQLSAQGGKNNAEMDQKIQTLMKDLTPESAAILQTSATPGVMSGHGVPEQSAAPTASMVSNLFGNLSTAKENGMSEEEYQSEAKATTNMLNLAMNANKSESSSMFGEESATGKTANEFVEEVFSSKVISQTMVETVYANGAEEDPVLNPLNSGRTLQETEREELLGALNEQWNGATEEQKADAEYQKQYIAMGSMMNLTIQITDSGITAA